MQIYFSGHSFKYEIEAVAKLFFPVERFSLHFDEIPLDIVSENLIFTRLNTFKDYTILWVWVKFEGDSFKLAFKLKNDTPNFNNECERNLCILVYTVLQSITNITPKWGILTGVRPVSLVQKYIRLGWDKNQIYDYFQTKFLVSTEKLNLAFSTAKVQIDLLSNVDPYSYSLYVAIPFCMSKCSYCSFVSHPIKENDKKVDEYVALLMVELSKTATLALELGLTLSTIYIGGGTPTALNERQLALVVDTIAKYFPLSQVKEYTIEAGRVDTITAEKLEIIKNAWGTVGAGETSNVRISINPQTFNDDVLTKIGRRHTALEVVECHNLAKNMGFIHINMDFIAGLPDDTFESFKVTMDKAVSLSPNNITVHTLSIKRSAELFKTSLNNTNHDDVFATQYMNDYAGEILLKNGYAPYYLYRQKNTLGNLENVGYAKSGDLSLYNIFIMEENHTILACGAGGVTKIVSPSDKNIKRIFNFKYHFEYINRFNEIIKRKEEVALLYD